MTDSPKKARVDNTDETTPPLAEKTKSTLAKKIVQPHELGNPDQQSDDEEALSEVASSVDKADACTLALDSILQKLPDNVSEYIRDNLPSGAQADVASLLVSKNLVTKSMIGLLDDTSCKELAHLLSDRTNLIFLKAVGRNCGALHSLKRKADDTRSESGLGPDSVAKLQSKFKAKYGMAIPGRFTVDGQVLSKIKKNELVRLAECDEPGPLSKKKRLVIDPLGKSVNLEDIGLPRAPYQCEAAHVGACITRFCLSAAMLGKMTPTEGLIYMARLFEVGEKTSVHTIRSADLGMRLEAVRGGYDDASSLGQRLASGQADILAACRAEGRSVSFASSASSTNRPRSHQRGDEPCRLYMRGKCHYGSNCKYRHDRSRGRQGKIWPQAGHATPGLKSSTSTSERSAAPGPPLETYIEKHLEETGRCFTEEAQGETEGFRNGGACTLPGQYPPLAEPQKKFAKSLAELLIQQGMKCGIDELLRSITGKPSPEQAESLERAGTEAATMARSALELQLGESVLVRQSGNSIYHGLLGAIAERLGLADLEFPNLGAEGLPLGISVPIPHTDLYPKFKPKKQELFKLPEIHSNYKSMSFAEVKGKADEIVLNEEANGYIRRLGRLESLDERRTYIRRAAVPKGGSYENGVRIVEDFKRSNSNLNSSIPNTARLPTVSHLRQLISSLSDAHSGAVTGYKLLQLDLRSAYRHLGIHPAERKNVSFTHTFKDGSTAAFENLVLSFGHSAAAYWFVRYATLALRCLETVLQAVFTDADAKAFGTYMYVDDGFFCIRIEVYIPAAMIIIIFWLLIGSGLSFPKLRINLEEGTVIGIKIKIGEHPTFEIDPAKTEKLLSNLRDLLLNRRTTEQALSSLAGKLNRYTSLRRYLRPYLQPFYGLLAVMRKLGRKSASCPDKSEVYIVAKFFVKVLSDPRAFHSVGPIRRSENGFAGTLLLFSDASTRALGGIIALRGESSSQESQHTIWFRKHIDETVTKPWNLISKDPRVKTESKDIVITELLAVCLALQEAERYFGRLSDYRVSIHVDNQAVATILKSMYSKNPTLATLLRSIVYRLARLTLTDCVIRWIPSGENWIADRISRGESSFLPTAWREIEITPTSLKALAPNECE